MREITLQIEEPAYKRLKHSLIAHHFTGQMDAASALVALIVKAIEHKYPKIIIREEPHGEESRERKAESG